VDRARYGTLFVLVGLADVEERVVVETARDIVRVDLANLRFGCVQ
jgi:hypothetical protein